jgi:hypothetical protein
MACRIASKGVAPAPTNPSDADPPRSVSRRGKSSRRPPPADYRNGRQGRAERPRDRGRPVHAKAVARPGTRETVACKHPRRLVAHVEVIEEGVSPGAKAVGLARDMLGRYSTRPEERLHRCEHESPSVSADDVDSKPCVCTFGVRRLLRPALDWELDGFRDPGLDFSSATATNDSNASIVTYWKVSDVYDPSCFVA